MRTNVSQSGYGTLKSFLGSCDSIVGSAALKTYFAFEGPFPTTFEEILGEYAFVIDVLPDNVFANLLKFAKAIGHDTITAETICLFFGSRKHLETAKVCPMYFKDLSGEQKIVGHLALPVRITEVSEKICGEIVYDGTPVCNLVNNMGDIKKGDVVIVHFASVVMLNPSELFLTQLKDEQQEFVEEHLPKITELTYSTTHNETLKRIEKNSQNHS